MTRKRFTADQIINKLRGADVLLSQGDTVVQTCKQIGVTEQTYYCWRNEYGGMKTDQGRCLEELERENTRLKKLLAEAELDKVILREAPSPNF